MGEERRMVTQRGFTLIEILTVIAIIALLAAITFPVFSQVKNSANRSADMSALNQLHTALNIYKIDQGGYPPQMLGYVSLYMTGPSAGNIIPASQTRLDLMTRKTTLAFGALVPNHLHASEVSILNDLTAPAPKPVVFPNQDASAVGTTPILNLDGTSGLVAANDLPGARQAYGPTDGAVCYHPQVDAIIAGTHCADTNAQLKQFYEISGFDTSGVPTGTGTTQYELRYARYWTKYTTGFDTSCIDTINTTGQCGGGGKYDDPRQLGYSDPPDDTVVTWDSYFRTYGSNGVPTADKQDMILTTGGSAKLISSKTVYDYSWRQRRAQ